MAKNPTMQHSLSPFGRPSDIVPSAAGNYAMSEDRAGVKSGLCPEGLMDLDAFIQVLPIPSSMAANVEIPANGVDTDVVAAKLSFRDMVRGQTGVHPQDNIIGDLDVDLHESDVKIRQQGTIPEICKCANHTTDSWDDCSVATSQLERSAFAVVGVQRPIDTEITTPAATVIQSSDAVVTETLDVVKDMNATVNIPVVASTARVVTAPSTVEDGLKRSVNDPVGSSMRGSIRKSNSKGAGRNNHLMNGVQRKLGKTKKQVGNVSTKVGVSEWVNNMARELTSGVSSTGPRIFEPLSDISNDCSGVQWIANSTFEGERHDASR
ncbi:hypothetical protein V6N12_065330 [Hibiscus sabdariffa]|uniref:Uncharacterized protein n=1 Tax=Hibiscus sabdariffa TaxID=183260 RepID=A0ABR2G8D7_9ROSI